jgi:hypothetical protein
MCSKEIMRMSRKAVYKKDEAWWQGDLQAMVETETTKFCCNDGIAWFM